MGALARPRSIVVLERKSRAGAQKRGSKFIRPKTRFWLYGAGDALKQPFSIKVPGGQALKTPASRHAAQKHRGTGASRAVWSIVCSCRRCDGSARIQHGLNDIETSPPRSEVFCKAAEEPIFSEIPSRGTAKSKRETD